MIYFTNKDGNIIGKKSPTDEQKKAYKKSGYKECNQDGSPMKKKRKKASKSKAKKK